MRGVWPLETSGSYSIEPPERRFDTDSKIAPTAGCRLARRGGAYAYGAYFHQYLADRFGPQSLVRLADETSGRVPYFGARAFRKVFGRSLGNLWDDFEADTRLRVRDDKSDRVRLTRHGFSVGAPAFSRSGRLFYSIINPHGFPSLMELPRGGSSPRQVATRYLGNRIAAAGELLVFDQIEIGTTSRCGRICTPSLPTAGPCAG